MVYFRNRRKSVFFVCFVFCPNFTLTRVKISWDKNHHFAKPPTYLYRQNIVSLLWSISYFWKFWHFLLKKTHFNLKRQSKVIFLTQLDFIIHILPILNQQNLAGRTFPPTLTIFFFYSLCLFFVLFCFSIICFKFWSTLMKISPF